MSTARCRILIDPLPRDFSAADLADLLRPFGQIVSTEIVTDPLGYSLGFGRAEMHSEEGADNVVKHLDGTAFHNGTIGGCGKDEGFGCGCSSSLPVMRVKYVREWIWQPPFNCGPFKDRISWCWI